MRPRRTTNGPCWSSRSPGRWRQRSVSWGACHSSWQRVRAGIAQCRRQPGYRQLSRIGSTRWYRVLSSTCPSLGSRCRHRSLFVNQHLRRRSIFRSISPEMLKRTQNNTILEGNRHAIIMLRYVGPVSGRHIHRGSQAIHRLALRTCGIRCSKTHLTSPFLRRSMSTWIPSSNVRKLSIQRPHAMTKELPTHPHSALRRGQTP